MSEKKVLHLTLSEKPFEVMVTGEKRREFREPSEWIKLRLFTKKGAEKRFDVVKFTHGYKKNAPYFIAEYLGVHAKVQPDKYSYSNGLTVYVKEGDLVIGLGDIIEKGNLTA